MLTKSLAETMSKSALQALVKDYSKQANVQLTELHESGADKLSISFTQKWGAYLSQHGTKRGKFRTGVSRATKAELVERLLNLQKFRQNIKDPEQIQAEAEKTAEQFGLDNTDDIAELFELVKYGFDSLAYKIGSDDMFKIVTERLNAGQTADEIKEAIDTAANLAENGNEFVQEFSEGGNWL